MLIIVPARKGSKGVPGKNTNSFCGFPLVEWSFAAALYLADKTGARIMCTTDDPVVADLVNAHYAKRILVHDRPADLASDHAAMAGVVLDACAQVDAQRFILLQPTSPLRLTSDLDGLCDAMRLSDTVVSCTVPCEHPKDLITLDSHDGRSLLGAPKTATRQDWKTEYRFVDGSFYSGRAPVLQETASFQPANTHYLTLSNPAAIDIDTPYDWAMAEAQHDWLLATRQVFVRPAR